MRIEIDIGDVDDELKTLTHDHKLALMFEAVLSAQFLTTQAAVHVITGSLKGSGNVSSRIRGTRWSGTIQYGGASPGFPNDPVVYAYYEWRRRGTHDFMAPAEVYDRAYGEAILQFLRGKGRR